MKSVHTIEVCDMHEASILMLSWDGCNWNNLLQAHIDFLAVPGLSTRSHLKCRLLERHKIDSVCLLLDEVPKSNFLQRRWGKCVGVMWGRTWKLEAEEYKGTFLPTMDLLYLVQCGLPEYDYKSTSCFILSLHIAKPKTLFIFLKQPHSSSDIANFSLEHEKMPFLCWCCLCIELVVLWICSSSFS